MRLKCELCGTLTGIHSFSFNSEGKYEDKPKDRIPDSETININLLDELLKTLAIVHGKRKIW